MATIISVEVLPQFKQLGKVAVSADHQSIHFRLEGNDWNEA